MHIQEMLHVGAIRPSNSPWTSAVVLVQKNDGKLRFCIDLWKLNARTIEDVYSLPRIDKTLDCLNGAEWFSSLDLKSVYWQVLHLCYCIIYLDDVIVFNKTPVEHVLRFRAVFEKLKEVGLKFKPSKCKLFRQELNYLGHVLSKDSIQTDPKKVEASISGQCPLM